AAARIAPRPLYDGQLDLSVDEGLGLAEGRLTLDGADVQLAPAARAQLAGLRPCQQALEALEPQTPKALSEPSIERKLTQAFECQRSGWGFADPVIATLTAFPLRPLP
ncbi:MAG: hypothetical protein H6Q89_5690, partial [Myxococcaceae bacterium]|nr:hypothetical protein [Myxococcaceae bacterium]